MTTESGIKTAIGTVVEIGFAFRGDRVPSEVYLVLADGTERRLRIQTKRARRLAWGLVQLTREFVLPRRLKAQVELELQEQKKAATETQAG
ncbi:MAG: hypothetical protein ACUVX1_17270 [Chloroflexota bacterium]